MKNINQYMALTMLFEPQKPPLRMSELAQIGHVSLSYLKSNPDRPIYMLHGAGISPADLHLQERYSPAGYVLVTTGTTPMGQHSYPSSFL
jgi:hypothetical protein